MKKDDLVQRWRADHKDELDRTLTVLISIRDNPEEKSKDRIDAGRSIARMLGGLAPDHDEENKAKQLLSRPEPMRTGVELEFDELLAKL